MPIILAPQEEGLGGSGFKASPGRRSARPPHLKLVMIVHTSHPSYMGSINRKVTVQTGPGINARPDLKNN
jgi:hypothetical protein